MIATGDFTFKSFVERESGCFTTSDGKTVRYEAGYILKFDDFQENGDVSQKTAVVEIDNYSLISKLSKFETYDPIRLKFNVRLSKDGKSGYLKLIDVLDEKEQKNEEQKENQEN